MAKEHFVSRRKRQWWNEKNTQLVWIHAHILWRIPFQLVKLLSNIYKMLAKQNMLGKKKKKRKSSLWPTKINKNRIFTKRSWLYIPGEIKFSYIEKANNFCSSTDHTGRMLDFLNFRILQWNYNRSLENPFSYNNETPEAESIRNNLDSRSRIQSWIEDNLYLFQSKKIKDRDKEEKKEKGAGRLLNSQIN